MNKVRLQWAGHQSALVSMIDNLLCSQALADVTLTCEGEMLQAHKLVLAAASPHFQNLFTTTGRLDPIIYMQGVKFAELQALINFIYRGEAKISQDNLPSFLSLAQDLKIRGLGENNLPLDSSPNRIRCKALNTPKRREIEDEACKYSANTNKTNYQRTSSTPPTKKVRTKRVPTTFSNLEEILHDTDEDEENVPVISSVAQNCSGSEDMENNESYDPELDDDHGIDHMKYFNHFLLHEEDTDEDKEGDVVEEFCGADWREVRAEDDSTGLSEIDGWHLADSGELLVEDDDCIPGSGGRSASDDDPSSCALCNKKFLKRKSLNTHCLYDCPMIEPKYNCPRCEYKARRGYQLKIHCLKIHGLVT